MRSASTVPLLVLTASTVATAQAPDPGASLPSDLPAWVYDVGARRAPDADRTCSANESGARADTTVKSTAAIQQAIDACTAAGGGMVTFAPGDYLTGALFLRSNVHLRVDSGVTLYGSHDDADYPDQPTRVAGIEMPWPVGLINVRDASNVRISGSGTIDGRGEKWWDRYWTMRRNDYEPRGLRWASDYDAKRVRLMVITDASDVTIDGLHLRRSGFWTVHVLYSELVTVRGLTISDNGGPSTDGINIDSSRRVLVQGNDIDNNDDTICLKAGRDSDGLRVNRPTEYVFIRDNIARRGAGVISFGSETSGGIRHIVAYRNRGIGTDEGIRFKTAKTRGGFVEDVLIRDVRMTDVPLPITFTLDWNPSYSYATIPDSIRNVPAHWRVLATPVLPAERGLCRIHDITIQNVKASGARRIFSAAGLPAMALENVTLRDVRIGGEEAGSIAYARDWAMNDVTLITADGQHVTVTGGEDVALPRVLQRPTAATTAPVSRTAHGDSVLAAMRRANRCHGEVAGPRRVTVTNRVRPATSGRAPSTTRG
jgi:hypothetical protein